MSDLATAFPINPGFVTASFKINTPSQVSETFSGKIRRVGLGISFYTWDIKYANLLPVDAGTITGFVSQTLGRQFSFEIIMPTISYSKAPNQTTSVPVVNGTKSIGSTTITLSGCGTSKNVLAAGDFFKFSNHSKVYMCVSPCVSNSSGVAILYFSCPLTTSVPSSSTVVITAVPFTAILSEDVQSFEIGQGGITNLSLSMREVW